MDARGVRTEVGVVVALAGLVFAFARAADALSWNSTTRAIVAALGLACFILIAAPLIALARQHRQVRQPAKRREVAEQLVIKEVVDLQRTKGAGRLSVGSITAGRVGNGHSGRVSTPS